jgi:hypothetical protein
MVCLERYFIAEEVLDRVIHCPHALLFVLVADLLQSIENKATEIGILKLPLDMGYTIDFSII